ncbi:MAG: hypothetical protein ABFD91_05325 [Anaerohalosphaeraceae bacterium]
MKLKKSTLFIVVSLILILLGYPLIYAYLREGRVTPKFDKVMRMRKLEELRLLVIGELDQSTDYDNCLYNIYKNNDRKIYTLLHTKDVFSYSQRQHENFLSDPNRFYERINYVLCHHDNGWILMEKSGDAIVPDVLAIDKEGAFYEIHEIKKKSDSECEGH